MEQNSGKDQSIGLELYYFSGTGNSLFVAKELQERLPGAKLTPIVACLKRDRVRTTAKSVGIVFPVQALGTPIAVRRFLRKVQIINTDYVFAVATREGTVYRGIPQVNRLLRKQGKKLRSHFILTMFSSDPRASGYRPPSKNEIDSLRRSLGPKLDEIAKAVQSQQTDLQDDTSYTVKMPYGRFISRLMERLVLFAHTFSAYVGGVNYFYSDDNCSGCGICERVCLSGKIQIKDNEPLWKREILCFMCFACVNFCPKQSVQIKSIWAVQSHTQENGRYFHPFATVKEIEWQKIGARKTWPSVH